MSVAGQFLTANRVTFALPDVDDDYLPLYGGKIWVVSNHGERLAVPYGGSLELRLCFLVLSY